MPSDRPALHDYRLTVPNILQALSGHYLREEDELFAESDDLREIIPRFLVRQVIAQSVVDGRRFEAIDLIEGGDGVAGKHLEDIPGACVIGRDHAIFSRDLIVDLLKQIVGQDIDIGTAELDVILRVEQNSRDGIVSFPLAFR